MIDYSKSVTIIGFVVFIDQLINYPINCTRLNSHHPAHAQNLILALVFHWIIVWCPMILFVDREGPYQTAQMLRLIWAFAVHICSFLHGTAHIYPKYSDRQAIWSGSILSASQPAIFAWYFKGSIFLKKKTFFYPRMVKKLIDGINMITKHAIWQPVKFQLVSHFWTESKMKWFFILSLN